MPAKADRIEDLYIAEKGNVSSMAEKKIPSNYFDMTLDECRLVFDTIDNLIIIDNQGIIKYFHLACFPWWRPITSGAAGCGGRKTH